MSQFFHIHPDNPQGRLIAQAGAILDRGGVIAYPTDSCYALGCHLGDKSALERIRSLRNMDKKHNFTLVCADLSAVALYARVSNTAYRVIKHNTPGPYTFILQATREVPRRVLHPKRKTIGIRIPDNRICLDLVKQLGQPLMSTTLILPGESQPLTDPSVIFEKLGNQLDLVIDGGFGKIDMTTVVSFLGDHLEVVRQGLGPEPLI